MRILKVGAGCLGLALVACLISAAQDQAGEQSEKRESQVLQPQMEPAGGWSSQGSMGEKSDTLWSDTTIGAGVSKKPLAGKSITVTGEIVDLSCYLQLGKHGEPHKACGTKCLTNGQPIGLVTHSGNVYMLMDEEHDPRRDGQTTFRKTAIDNFAKVMEVTGTETTIRGIHAVYVKGYVNK